MYMFETIKFILSVIGVLIFLFILGMVGAAMWLSLSWGWNLVMGIF